MSSALRVMTRPAPSQTVHARRFRFRASDHGSVAAAREARDRQVAKLRLAGAAPAALRTYAILADPAAVARFGAAEASFTVVERGLFEADADYRVLPSGRLLTPLR